MMEKANALLQKYFGYPSFRAGQAPVVEAILNGQDVLAIMPTGAGKSICYQIPALLLPGVTIVISPLISLMKDQADSLRQAGIESYELNSSISYEEQMYRKQRFLDGHAKILYVAPERLLSVDFIRFISELTVSMVAVDEAHCVSSWGHDFRKSYLEISTFVGQFEVRPIVTAFTATATEHVQSDILQLLKLNNPHKTIIGVNRPNLYFAVDTPKDRLSYCIRYIHSKSIQSGIIYCITRKEVEAVHEALCTAGILVERYHAGLSEAERTRAQENFLYDRSKIMVATNAFGMGIDKSNIRFVIHYGMPRTVENYYQEAGRAGRDGELSECILLYAPKDIMINKFMIGNSEGEQGKELAKLQDMISYSTTKVCLRTFLLRYFGEKGTEENCGSCSNCDCQLEEMDITTEAQKILSNVIRMGNHPAFSELIETLLGAESRQEQYGTLSTFGILKELPRERVEALVEALVRKKLLVKDEGIFMVLPAAKPVLAGKENVINRRFLKQAREESQKLYDSGLYAALVQFRWKAGAERHVPPYIIFSDSTLKEIAQKKPADKNALLQIHGMGESKAGQYGTDILKLVTEYGTNSPKQKKQGRTRQSSRAESLRLYESGKTLREIAKERGLTTQTIGSHLLECKLEGVKVDGLIQEEYREDILKAIEKVGKERLRPIKDVLPKEVSYISIEYYLRLGQDG